MYKSLNYRWYVLVGKKVHEFGNFTEAGKFMRKRRNHYPLFQCEIASGVFTPMQWMKRKGDAAYELRYLPYDTPVPKLILMHRLLSGD